VYLIFLTYINRSGSTFLAHQLSKSVDILVCPEAEVLLEEFLVNPAKQFRLTKSREGKLKSILISDEKLKHWGLNFNEIKGLEKCELNADAFITILMHYRMITKPDATHIVFKAERLIQLISNLPHYFRDKYDLKIISIVRDCRAVFYSQKSTLWLNGNDYMSKNPVHTAFRWRDFIKTMKSNISNQWFFLIKYEELIENFDTVFTRLLSGLRVSVFESGAYEGDLYDRLPVNQQKLHKNITEKAIPEKINEWKDNLAVREKKIIESVANNALSYMGYKTQFSFLDYFNLYPGVIITYFVSAGSKIFRKTKYHISK